MSESPILTDMSQQGIQLQAQQQVSDAVNVQPLPQTQATQQQAQQQVPSFSDAINVQPLPQTQAIRPGTGRGRGPGLTGGPGLFEVSSTGEILHEGIPQSKELEHLAELKEFASEHTRGGIGIPRGSAASIARKDSKLT